MISGLDIGSNSASDAQIQMLAEYLTGESGDVESQVSASRISRLIIAGDSLASVAPAIGEPLSTAEDRKAVRFDPFLAKYFGLTPAFSESMVKTRARSRRIPF